MQLDFDAIKAITCGAAWVEEREEGIFFHLFTREQEALYYADERPVKRHFDRKTKSTSGIKLVFLTDSRSLKLKAALSKATTRRYATFELWVNREPVDTLQNYETPYPPGDPEWEFPYGEYEKEFSLGEGEKLVEVFFPWSTCTVLQALSVDDGAKVVPVKRQKKLLCFGDSITQGYDILRFSQHYTSRLADLLDAELYNKAIGGEVYFSALAETKESFTPDYITVAYGSNDFRKTDRPSFEANCKAFYAALRANYPEAKIFALTPIWREDENKEGVFGSFELAEKGIREAAAQQPGVTVIRGYDFVPHDPALYADLRLHPNDEGFAHFGNNLLQEIKNYI